MANKIIGRNGTEFGIFSFFTGAGFLDLGFEDAGLRSYLANELDSNFASVYRYSRAQMLWRAANALNTGLPINLDRILAGSYNTRSVLEALLAYTPEIYTCHPGRQESIGDCVKIKRGHKHIMFKDNLPHEIGQVVEMPLGDDFVSSKYTFTIELITRGSNEML